MSWFVISLFVVPTIFLILWALINYYETLSRICMCIAIIYAIGGCGFMLFGAYKLSSMAWCVDKDPYLVEDIIALNDGSSLYGQFYISRGYIDEEMYYRYMVETDDGGFVAGKTKSDSATLYYTDSNYRVEWYNRRKEWLWFSEEGYLTKIYIPEESIVERFNVDLE